MAGLIKALDQVGLPPIAEEAREFTVAAGYKASMTLLRDNSLDALVCANDASTIGALTAARERGMEVPGPCRLWALTISKWSDGRPST
ncbi:substrate-binding domain-containing protein [Ruegeria arenilitoris]|uniref:substrate-binding domain-containing protein n=1 Tax=Ruegeria arenilitoris TaxID=1173585 RepID=UPI00147FF3C0